MDKKLFVGLDVGTNSVGWAATDEDFNLYRLKGETAWGTRLFDEAQTAKKRRKRRASKRRLARRKQRIQWLNEEIFRTALAEKDPNFLTRLQNSAFFPDDKDEKAKSACLLFPTKSEEKAFFKRFPTIWHLRLALIKGEDDAFSDIRQVYLAIHHIIKYRGNFLRDGDVDVKNLSRDILDQANSFFNRKAKELSMEEDGDMEDAEPYCFLAPEDFPEFQKIIENKENSKGKQKAINGLVNKPSNKRLNKLIDLFLKLCTAGHAAWKSSPDQTKSDQIDFRKSSEDDISQYTSILGDDSEIMFLAKQVFDFQTLHDILRNAESLSEAFVNVYEKHKTEKEALKQLVKSIDEREGLRGEKSLYFRIFIDPSSKSNYPAYIRDPKSVHYKAAKKEDSEAEGDEEKKKKGEKGHTIEEFNTFIRNTLAPYELSMSEQEKAIWLCPENPELGLKSAVEEKRLLETISVRSTGCVPMQLHLKELSKIIENGSAKGIAVLKDNADKLIKLFKYKIPYYCGPLRPDETGNRRTNIHFKESSLKETITPWNIGEKIDYEATKIEFTQNLTRSCSQLWGERVLPRFSLLFEEYDTYNKINGLKVNGESLPFKDRKALADHAFGSAQPLTMKGIQSFLRTLNPAYANADIAGFSKTDTISATSHAFFSKSSFRFNLSNRYSKEYEMAEKIILYRTVFADSPKDGIEVIKKEFNLSPKQESDLSNLNPKKWASFSKAFLTLPYITENGEVKSTFIDILKETGRVANAILFDPTYRFQETIKAINERAFGEKSDEEKIAEIFESIPPATRRSVTQAKRIVEEIVKFSGKEPDEIVIEVTRGPGEKGYTDSRRTQLEKWFDKLDEAGEDTAVCRTELSEIDNDSLRKQNLYLYFLQNGKDAYSGNTIEIKDVLEGVKYDRDHIIPQSYGKTDNSFDNLVLVTKEANERRKNKYPIPADVVDRKRMPGFWKRWYEAGLMSKEKYENLMRLTPITEDELNGFVNAQLNVVSQTAVALKKIFEIQYPKITPIFSRSSFPSQIRDELGIAKLRDLNDTHHAVDAYLNIITGVKLNKRFSDGRIAHSLAKAAKENPESEVKESLNMKRYISSLILRGKDRQRTELGEKIYRTSQRHTMQLTYQPSYPDGAFYKETILPKKSGLQPIHVKKDTPYLKTEKYGGYTYLYTEYYVMVTIPDRNHRALVPVSHLLATLYQNDMPGLERKLAHDFLKLKKGEVARFHWNTVLRNNTKILYGSLPVLFLNAEGKRVTLKPFAPIFLSPATTQYIKDYGACIEKGRIPKDQQEAISIPKNSQEGRFVFSRERNLSIVKEILAIARLDRYNGIGPIEKIRNINPDAFLTEHAENLIEEYSCIRSLISLFTRNFGLCQKGINKDFRIQCSTLLKRKITILNESFTGLVSRPISFDPNK